MSGGASSGMVAASNYLGVGSHTRCSNCLDVITV